MTKSPAGEITYGIYPESIAQLKIQSQIFKGKSKGIHVVERPSQRKSVNGISEFHTAIRMLWLRLG